MLDQAVVFCFSQHDVQNNTPGFSKGAEKQLDYILVNRKYMRCSEYAEAHDLIHMGSDHRSVMAQCVIQKPEKKGSQNRFKGGKLNNGEHQKSDA